MEYTLRVSRESRSKSEEYLAMICWYLIRVYWELTGLELVLLLALARLAFAQNGFAFSAPFAASRRYMSLSFECSQEILPNKPR